MRVVTGLFVLLVPAAALPAEPTSRELLAAFELQQKAVHEAAGPAVACVVVSRSDQYPPPPAPPDYPGRLGGFDPDAFRRADPGRAAVARRLDLADGLSALSNESAGGVVIDPAGLVLTHFHAIDGATKVYVHLPGGKGSYADVYAADARSDLAVLKLLAPPPGLKAVKLGEVRLETFAGGPPTVFPGKVVVVLAHQPLGRFAPDHAGGHWSTVTRVVYPDPPPGVNDPPWTVYRYAPLLEFDSRSTPAVSGAAVFNLDGELVGLASGVAAAGGGDGGRGYAVPIDANARRVVAVLAKGEEVEYGFLGIASNRNQLGRVEIVVDTVTPNSPAAGLLQPGDVITRINGNTVKRFPDLLYHVGGTLAGNTLTLAVRGRERPVEITVAKYRNDQPFVAANRPAPVFGLRVDWSSVLAQVVPPGVTVPPGVMVRETMPGSPAAAKFKDIGENGRWLVTAVNGTATPTVAAFYAAARNRESVRLTVIDPADRGSRPREVVLP
jgi:serine protease Do